MARARSRWRSSPPTGRRQTLAQFARYDLNHDGIITAEECLKVEKANAGSKQQ